MNKLHIGYHKTGTTWLQKLIFPQVPNYAGRYINSSNVDPDTIKIQKTQKQIQGSDNLLNHFSQFENIFYSCEIFSNIPNKELFRLLEKYPTFNQVLVTTRNFNDLIRSRTQHNTPYFYLQPKLKKGIIDDEVKLHYSTDNLKAHIPNLTIVDMDKIWNKGEVEIKRLSLWLGLDVKNLILRHIDRKINSNKR